MDQTTKEASGVQAFGQRRFGRVNWLGLWTLYEKETRRFLKVSAQTVFAPVITSLLFLMVFSVALQRSDVTINGVSVPFASFMAAGLIMMSIIQNAFANSSSSLLVSKVQGNIVDYLMPPVSPLELTVAIAAGAVTRGVCVAIAAWIALSLFAWAAGAAPLGATHLWAILFFGFSAALAMSLVGILGGIWADKFDHLATVTNFLITPLAFLSGTFYSVSRLPEPWLTISHFNPVFYVIDGFRYGVLGVHEGQLAVGVITLLVLNAGLGVLCWLCFKTGYRIKP